MGIIDFSGLKCWLATAYQLYMFQENDTVQGSTNVVLSSPVGQIDEQSNALEIGNDLDVDRPTYTSEGAANSYITFNASHGLIVRNSQTYFSFLLGPSQIWTIAFKIRFKNATPAIERIFSNSAVSNSQAGINIYRSATTTTLYISDGGGGTLLIQIDAPVINDTLWHNIVIKSNGPGVNAVNLEIDGSSNLGTYDHAATVDTPSQRDLEIGWIVRNDPLDGDISDLIIMDQVISAQDQTTWENTDTSPTMDSIAIALQWVGLIRAVNASIVPSLINVNGIR